MKQYPVKGIDRTVWTYGRNSGRVCVRVTFEEGAQRFPAGSIAEAIAQVAARDPRTEKASAQLCILSGTGVASVDLALMATIRHHNSSMEVALVTDGSTARFWSHNDIGRPDWVTCLPLGGPEGVHLTDMDELVIASPTPGAFRQIVRRVRASMETGKPYLWVACTPHDQRLAERSVQRDPRWRISYPVMA